MNLHLQHRPEDVHVALLPVSVSFGPEVPDGVDIWVGGTPAAADLARLRTGATVVIPFAGLPEATRSVLLERPDLRVYNLHHNADLVAEHTIGLLLAVSRNLLPMDNALRRGDWRPRYTDDPSLQLHGQRAVVVGFGAIGQRVARILGALGVQVDGVGRPDLGRLDALLLGARVLILAVPHTSETTG